MYVYVYVYVYVYNVYVCIFILQSLVSCIHNSTVSCQHLPIHCLSNIMCLIYLTYQYLYLVTYTSYFTRFSSSHITPYYYYYTTTSYASPLVLMSKHVPIILSLIQSCMCLISQDYIQTIFLPKKTGHIFHLNKHVYLKLQRYLNHVNYMFMLSAQPIYILTSPEYQILDKEIHCCVSTLYMVGISTLKYKRRAFTRKIRARLFHVEVFVILY